MNPEQVIRVFRPRSAIPSRRRLTQGTRDNNKDNDDNNNNDNDV